MAKRKKAKEEENTLRRIFDSFTSNMNGLLEFVNNLAPVVTKYDDKQIRKIEQVTKKIAKIIGPSGEITAKEREISIKGEITEEKVGELITVLKKLPRLTVNQAELLYRSSFIMLISYFDYFLSDIMHCYYESYPKSISGKDFSINLNELNLCSDIKEAIQVVINKKIDSVLYDNLKRQKDYLKNELRIEIKEDIIEWNIIDEATERRNIIVHNNGVINKRYLENVDFSIVPEKKKDIKEGEEISVNEEYFKRVFNEILIAGIILIECCWRKWKKDDIDAADARLINAMYRELEREEWHIAERLGLYSKEKDFEAYNTANRLYLDINYCQSLKWNKKQNELDRELKKFDISTLSPKYIVAICALKSDKEKFYENVEKAITIDNMEEDSFANWPLFRELRRDSEYEEKIRAAFEKKTES
jgi:hypothetical protein